MTRKPIKSVPTGHEENHISHENGIGHDHESTGYQNGKGHQKFHFDQGNPDSDTFVFADPVGHDEDHISHENGIGHMHDSIGFMNGVGHQKFHEEDPVICDPQLTGEDCCVFGDLGDCPFQ